MKKNPINIAKLITLTVFFATTSYSQVNQQKIGDNPTIINSNAALEIESTNKGLLLPRVKLSGISDPSPLTSHVEGMTVYNTVSNGTGVNEVIPGYYFNDGSKWIRIATGSDNKKEPWYIQETTTEAISNTDNIYQMGSVAIGTDKAYEDVALEVNGSIRVGDEHVGSVGPFSASFGNRNEASNYYSFSIGSDNISSGYYSFSSGVGNTAEGYHSFAQGSYNNAMGSNAIIFGRNNDSNNSNFSVSLGVENKIDGDAVAIGEANEVYTDYAFAVGRQNEINPDASYAATFGRSNEIDGQYAIAFGKENSSLGTYAMSVGELNKANGSYSLSIGKSNTVDGIYGLGLGNENTVSGEYAAAIGSSNTINGNYGIAVGSNLTPSSNYELNIGKFNAITTGNATTWDATDALVQIANGSDESTRNNAVTVLKNGYIGVGINGAGNLAKPTERLDIGSGSVRVRDINTVTGTTSDNLVVADANGILKTVASNSLITPEPWRIVNTTTEATSNTQNIYQNANVGIGDFSTSAPVSTLEVKGSLRVGDNHIGQIGTNSVAFGSYNIASGAHSFASGRSNKSTHNDTFAVGYASEANATQAIGMGTVAIANGKNSVAIGRQLIASSFSEFVAGNGNAITTSAGDGWNPTDALFQIGNQSLVTNAPRSNALTLLKSGDMGIGIDGTEAIAKPTERLDIGSGKLRIRDINTTTGEFTNQKVVADSNGVLKTVSHLGAVYGNIRVISSNYTVQEDDYTLCIEEDPNNPNNNDPILINLPNPSENLGRIFVIRPLASIVIELNYPVMYRSGYSESTIYNEEIWTIQSDGTKWIILHKTN